MPSYRKRGKSYYLCWSENGQEQRRSLGAISVGEAREAVRLKKEELHRRKLSNVVELPHGHIPTVAEFATEYLRWHERQYPDSYERVSGIFERHIVPYCGTTPLNRLSKGQTERYIDKRLDAGRKSATVEKELRAWNAMLNRAVYLEFIDRNPIKGVRAPRSTDSKPPRWYTAEELDRIYANSKPLAGDEAVKGKPINSSVEDYAPVWRLMANTGMRRGEVVQLKWRDVDDSVLRILSAGSARTKSGKWRQVPLSSGALAALEALESVRGRSAYVAPQVHPNSLSRAFDKAVERASLDGSIHCLRHTFVAHLVTRGVPLRTVQVLAGHASVATTERYAHLAPGYLRNSVAGLNL